MCKTYSYGSQTEELSIYVPHDDLSAHVYYCAARPRDPHPECPDPSNTLRVKPLSKLDCTILSMIMNIHACRSA